MSMGGGGSGGAQTQMGQWSDQVAPGWTQAVEWGRALVDPTSPTGQYHQYNGQTGDLRDNGGQWFGSNPGQRIAGLTSDQEAAANNTRTFLNQLENPYQAVNGAIDQTTSTLNGDYLNANRYATQGNPYVGGTNAFANYDNPFAQQQNDYIGDNPYFRGMLQQGQQDITDAYQRGTAADTTRMFNLSGAFGGSAHQQVVANNQAGLGRSLSNYTQGMQNQQYDRSGQLQEADLGRMGSQWGQDLARRGGLVGEDMSRNMQGQEAGLNRASQNYQNERGNQMNAIGLGNSQQALALQRAQAQMSIGDMFRGYNQDLLNQHYNDYQDENNQQFRMLDVLTSLMSRASGGMAPSSTTTQSGYSASPYSQLLGAGLLGHSAGLY